MQTLGGEMLQVDVDTRTCKTEPIISECSSNNKECKCGFFAGKSSTYLLSATTSWTEMSAITS